MMGEAATELGAVAVLGFAFLLIIRWMINQQSQQLSDVSNAIRASALIQLDMHKTLIMHDAQIRGVHPSAGKDRTEAHETAIGEYRKVIAAIDTTASAIKASINASTRLENKLV